MVVHQLISAAVCNDPAAQIQKLRTVKGNSSGHRLSKKLLAHTPGGAYLLRNQKPSGFFQRGERERICVAGDPVELYYLRGDSLALKTLCR